MRKVDLKVKAHPFIAAIVVIVILSGFIGLTRLKVKAQSGKEIVLTPEQQKLVVDLVEKQTAEINAVQQKYGAQIDGITTTLMQVVYKVDPKEWRIALIEPGNGKDKQPDPTKGIKFVKIEPLSGSALQQAAPAGK
jgi:hypothetical protein